MINLTATTESNPQIIAVWTVPYGSYWWKLRCVAWISQDRVNLRTTVYYKWQIEQWNYFPYWNDEHIYTLTLAEHSSSVRFSLPQSTSNGVRDMCSAQTLGVYAHNPTTGEYANTFRFQGAYTWSTFDYSEAMTFPTLSVPEPSPEPEPTPEPEPDPPTPIEFDNDPHYYLYADSDLVYAAGIEGYEVLNPKLTVEVNKAGSLQFDIPMGSEMYNRLSKLKTTIEARQGNEVLFRGRVLNTKRNMLNTITYYCEGCISWMVDIMTLPYTFNGQARNLLKQYLEQYNGRASENRQIEYVYSDISANVSLEQKEFSNTWNEIKNVLIDGIGGYVVPYLTSEITGLQWLSTYGASTSQVIEFGRNLLDFSEYIDASKIFTAVRPYGKEINGSKVYLPEGFVQDDDAIAIYGRIERTVIFDEITTVAALRTAASDYLRTGLSSAVSITIKAVDMHLLNLNVERIRLGDSVRVVSVPHGIDAYFLCTKITYDFAHPKNTEYTFGATQRTISELTDASYNRYVITEGDTNQ